MLRTVPASFHHPVLHFCKSITECVDLMGIENLTVRPAAFHVQVRAAGDSLVVEIDGNSAVAVRFDLDFGNMIVLGRVADNLIFVNDCPSVAAGMFKYCCHFVLPLFMTGFLDCGRLVSVGVVFFDEATSFGASVVDFSRFHFLAFLFVRFHPVVYTDYSLKVERSIAQYVE